MLSSSVCRGEDSVADGAAVIPGRLSGGFDWKRSTVVWHGGVTSIMLMVSQVGGHLEQTVTRTGESVAQRFNVLLKLLDRPEKAAAKAAERHLEADTLPIVPQCCVLLSLMMAGFVSLCGKLGVVAELGMARSLDFTSAPKELMCQTSRFTPFETFFRDYALRETMLIHLLFKSG